MLGQPEHLARSHWREVVLWDDVCLRVVFNLRNRSFESGRDMVVKIMALVNTDCLVSHAFLQQLLNQLDQHYVVTVEQIFDLMH